MIGYFGDVVFSTSSNKILSFRDLKLTAGSSWGEHKRIGQKSQWEFLGPSPQKVSFVVELDASYGVDPREMIEKLVSYAENGSLNVLVVGEKRIGNMWRTTNVSADWNRIIGHGRLVKASVALTIEEY